ncbi:hypothetical protein [Streptacidiphilus sp. PAMC 29251]
MSIARAGQRSPLSPYPVPSPPAEPLAGAEQDAVLRLLGQLRPRPATVVIGTAREPECLRTAWLLGSRWRDEGGVVLDTVTWPEHAASWLRQAHRFTRSEPDAWIVSGLLPGWVQLGRRLALSTAWDPARTVATASLAHQDLIVHGGAGTFDGLRGAHRDGGSWQIDGSRLVNHPRPGATPVPDRTHHGQTT